MAGSDPNVQKPGQIPSSKWRAPPPSELGLLSKSPMPNVQTKGQKQVLREFRAYNLPDSAYPEGPVPSMNDYRKGGKNEKGAGLQTGVMTWSQS